MSNCKVVAFFNEDLDEIEPVFTVGDVDRGVFQEETGRTIMFGDKIAGCLGVSMIWSGVGVGWCIMDKNLTKQQRLIVGKTCKKRLPNFMDLIGIHRIQADVKNGFDVGKRFVEFLGFESEGIMKAFGPDKEDYERFALVRC